MADWKPISKERPPEGCWPTLQRGPTDLFSQLERERNKELEKRGPPEYLEDNGTSRKEPLIPLESDDL